MPTQLPNCPGVINYKFDRVTTSNLVVTGSLTLDQLTFTSDLITKIYLYTTTYGLGISANQLNVFFPSAAATTFTCGTTEVVRIDASGLDVTGTLTSNAIPIYPSTLSGLYDMSAKSTQDFVFPSDARRVTVVWANLSNPTNFMVRITLKVNTTAINADSVAQNYTASTYNNTYVAIWNGASTVWYPAYDFNGHMTFTKVGTVLSGGVLYYQWSISGTNAAYDGVNKNVCVISGQFSRPSTSMVNRITFTGGSNFGANTFVGCIYE